MGDYLSRHLQKQLQHEKTEAEVKGYFEKTMAEVEDKPHEDRSDDTESERIKLWKSERKRNFVGTSGGGAGNEARLRREEEEDYEVAANRDTRARLVKKDT